jgi:hypothetical protein
MSRVEFEGGKSYTFVWSEGKIWIIFPFSRKYWARKKAIALLREMGYTSVKGKGRTWDRDMGAAYSCICFETNKLKRNAKRHFNVL